MSATLIAVIFALALGHLAPALAASLRRHDLFDAWTRWLSAQFPGEHDAWRGRFGGLIALLPALLIVGLCQYALRGPLVGVLGLLFGAAVLFLVWGPRDLDVDVNAILDADDAGARHAAMSRLDGTDVTATHEGAALVEAVFGSALRRWFGVLFWFLLLGPVGAVLYRLTALMAEGPESGGIPDANRAGMRRLFAWLNWPVAQLMTFSLALAGDFDTVIGAWKDTGGARAVAAHAFLGAAARASVRSEVAEEAEELIEEGVAPGNAWMQLGELPELRDAMSLVWRILLLWLAVLALFVIAGWVS